MSNDLNGDGDSGRQEVRRETFSDGSAVVELANGSLLLLESKSARTANFAEQPAPYDQPAPKPMRRDEN
jgi:hypothetical protein